MTNSMEHIYNAVVELSETGSKKEKERILADIAKDPDGRWLLDRVYNPFVTYGVTAVNGIAANAPVSSHARPFRRAEIEPLLGKLERRELTGNAAREALVTAMALLDMPGRQLLFWILKKDLQAGVNVTTVNKVVPGLLPVFAVARAHVYDAKRVPDWSAGVSVEPKLDGMRVTFIAKDSGAGFFTRAGHPLPALDHLIPDILETFERVKDRRESGTKPFYHQFYQRFYEYISRNDRPNFVLDGEVITGLFASTGKVRGKGKAKDAEFHLFDILSFDDFDAPGAVGPGYFDRRMMLREFHSSVPEGCETIQLVPNYQATSHDGVMRLFELFLNMPLATYLARGDTEREQKLLKELIDAETGEPKMLEGAIVKLPLGSYEKKKGYNWMKLKAEETEDLVVVGVFQGEAFSRNANRLGGLIVERNGVQVRVGGGFSDEDRDTIWNDWLEDAWVLRAQPQVGYDGLAYEQAEIQKHRKSHDLTLLGRMIEVKYHEVTPDGSLRHPRFVRFRDDKQGEIEDKALVVAQPDRFQQMTGFGRF